MLSNIIPHQADDNSSIVIRQITDQYFSETCHFHEELELNLILKSSGIRFVGDSVMGFQENDLVLLGANVPHTWKNDLPYSGYEEGRRAEAIVVRFPETFLGKDQFSMPEFHQVQTLLEKAKRGLLISGDGKERIVSSIKKMVNYKGMERLIIFLGVLNAIIKTCETTYLSSDGFMVSLNPKNENRMNDVYHFITNNFHKKILLAEIADIAQMNPSAFSRYFSQVTGKAITTFLQDIRLAYAKRLLVLTDMKISDILESSGFHNQAYFNKLFVDQLGMTPKIYRKKHID